MSKQDHWARVLRALAERQHGDDAAARRRAEDALGLARTVTDDIAGCSVTQATASGFHTPIASNRLAHELDEAQYAAFDGPCIAACRDGRAHSITTMAAEQRYPGFTAVAEQHGVRSSLSLPLPRTAQPSALNLYAQSLSAFEDARTRDTAELLARCIAMLLPEAASPWPSPSPSAPEVEAARSRRDLVRGAQAVLAAHGVAADEAFEVMRQRSVTRCSSIFDVARDIVERDDV